MKNAFHPRESGDLKKASSRSRIKSGMGFLFALAFFFFAPHVFAATINLSPSSGSFGVGSTFSISVRVNTQGQDTNTAEANISYSTATLDLVSIKQGATYYLSAPGSPSKGSGTAYFGGGLPTPGYNGAGGILGTMTFRARALGPATVSVSSGHVLLNDGNGTDSYGGSSSVQYTITPPAVGGPEVSSSSHPDQNSWYAKSTADLSWTRPTNAYGFSFELDQNLDTVPDNILDTTLTTTKSYPDLKDGIWYFHIKARLQAASAPFGATTNFKIQVDTAKPLLFDIKLVGESDLNDVTRTPTITFEAKDETSGIDHYNVYIDGNLIQGKAESPYNFEKLAAGPHVIRVVAVDRAGNDRKTELPIIVSAPAGFLQQTLSLPIYILLGINFLILILIALILWLLFRRKRKKQPSDEIASIQAEIDESLENLKRDINQKLVRLAERASKNTLATEVDTMREVTVKVNKTRKTIDKKMGKLSKKLPKKPVDDKILS